MYCNYRKGFGAFLSRLNVRGKAFYGLSTSELLHHIGLQVAFRVGLEALFRCATFYRPSWMYLSGNHVARGSLFPRTETSGWRWRFQTESYRNCYV